MINTSSIAPVSKPCLHARDLKRWGGLAPSRASPLLVFHPPAYLNINLSFNQGYRTQRTQRINIKTRDKL